MRIYKLMMISLFLCGDYVMCMEIAAAADKSKRVRKLDEAHAIVASSTREAWQRHSFSSSVVVEIIKKEKLCCVGRLHEEEISFVKEMKKNNKEAYNQLITELYDVFCGTKGELQNMRETKLFLCEGDASRKQEHLKTMQESIVYYDDYNKKHVKFWNTFKKKPCNHLSQVCAFLFVELMLITSFIVPAAVCYGNY